jgi:hypothetical protein
MPDFTYNHRSRQTKKKLVGAMAPLRFLIWKSHESARIGKRVRRITKEKTGNNVKKIKCHHQNIGSKAKTAVTAKSTTDIFNACLL